jgi:DNA-binding HxlR family transcriptional regulator
VPVQRGLEYCPVSAGVEAVGDRWTLLVLRELLMGSRHFNDIHRGLPGLNRTMLSTRLRRMQVNVCSPGTKAPTAGSTTA